MEQPPSTEKTGPQKGDVIDGKLEIEGIIAEGRTSTVVSAVDRGNGGKKVAVKIARGSDLESVERFRRAARGMAKLTSPHVVKVLGVGTTAEGSPCMSMEYLEGRTLAQKITQSGPLPIDEATTLMLQVCDALEDAHSQKLLHRDLDAENLFLAMPPLGSGGQPTVRVLDFGLAPVWRLGKGDGRLRPGDVPGTSFAMAPELARGADLDERVDVWGVGACLYRLLTNRHPYSARNLAELCTRILAERPPDLAKARPDVTPGLAAVVKKCLEREPNDRYRTIAEVITALEATRDEAPHTPQVMTERATLEQLREIESAQSRMTPMVLRAAEKAAEADQLVTDGRATNPGPMVRRQHDDLDAATAIHSRKDRIPQTPVVHSPASRGLAPPSVDIHLLDSDEPETAMFDRRELEAAAAVRGTSTVKQEPTAAAIAAATSPKLPSTLKIEGDGASPRFGEDEIGASTPHTMRIVPAFEAIAARLELPKLKRSDPPPKRSDPPPRLEPPPKRSDPPAKKSGLPPPLPPPGAPFLATSGASSSQPAHAPRALEIVAEDGPSTQPLGRLSPFAELPKAPPDAGPASDDPSIIPVLVGGPHAPAPLPKPSPATMAMETMAPPGQSAFAPLPKPSPAMMAQETVQGPAPVPAAGLGMGAAPLFGPSLPSGPPAPLFGTSHSASPGALPRLAPVHAAVPTPSDIPPPAPLPRPSPAMMEAETIPRGVEPPVPADPNPSPLVFQASPRVFEMSQGMLGRGTAAMPTPTPAPLPSAPPIAVASQPAFPSGAPHAMGSQPAFPSGAPATMGSEPVFHGGAPNAMPSLASVESPTAEPRKSKLLVPLIFALGIAVSIVVGLYVARATLPTTKPDAAPSSATHAATGSATPGESAPTAATSSAAGAQGVPGPPGTAESASGGTLSIAPADPQAPDGDADAAASPSPSPPASHRRHHRRTPTPPSPSAAPVKSGNVYDPDLY